MKQQLIHLSLREFILSTFSYLIKFARLRLVIRMLSFGGFPQWKFCSTPQYKPGHHLIHSLNRSQVLIVLSSGLIPVDTTSPSNTTLMVIDPLLASVHQSYSPFFLVTTTTCFNGPPRNSSRLVSVTNWLHWIPGRKQFDLIRTQPTKNPQSQQKKRFSTIMINSFFLHSKLFSETGGFLIDGARFMKIRFCDPPVLKSQTKSSLIFPFP